MKIMTTTKKLFSAILAIVMVAALLLGCVACAPADKGDSGNSGNTGNNEDNKNKYEGMTDAEYAQALTLNELEGFADALAAGVGAYAGLSGTTTENVGGTAGIELMLGDMIIDLLEQSIFGTADSGMDMSFLTSIGLNMEIDSTADLAQLQVALGLSDTEIVKLLLLVSEDTIWAGAPDLTDSFLEVGLDDMGIAPGGMTAVTPNWMNSLPSIIPSEEKLAEILNRYFALALKEIETVERKQTTLELDGLKQDATELTVKIYEQDALDAVKAVLTAAKTDADIKKIVEDFGTFYNDMMTEMNAEYDMTWEEVDAYAEFTKAVDAALKDLPAEAETETYIGLILYVDGDHDVIGCSLDMGAIYTQSNDVTAGNAVVTTSADTAAPDKQETFIMFTSYTVTEGDKFASIFEAADGEFVITGKGTTSNGVITGTYAITAEDITGLIIELKNFDTTDKDALSGTVIVKIGEDLMQEADMPFKDVALELKLDITNEKADVEAKLIGDDAMIVGIVLKVASRAPAAIQKPTNTVELTGQQAVVDLLMGMDFTTVLDNLREAGVPEMLVTALEGMIPVM